MATPAPDEPVAKYRRIMNDFITKINSGELRPGDPIPSTAELMASYGFSYTPVNTGMQLLIELGYIVSLQGIGRFVASNPPPPAREA